MAAELIQKLRAAASPLRQFVVRAFLKRSIRHLHGPEDPQLAPDDVIALCRVKNGAAYLPSFLDHHRALGVRHFVFLDNGSKDETVRMLSGAKDITLLATDFPYKKNHILMSQYLVDRFGVGRWSLTLDIDEYFDYPNSDVTPLPRLIFYLQENGYTAMTCHMLDMYPKRFTPQLREAFDRRTHRFYEIDTIEETDYPPYYRCRCEDENIKIYWGGVRKRVFADCPCLTKHSLLYRTAQSKRAYSDQFVTGANIADVSGVLYHYKFVSGFDDLVEEAVRFGHHYMNSQSHRRYKKVLDRDSAVEFISPHTRALRDANELVENGFLYVSDRYQSFAALAARTAR